jgi:hypothetical protein
VSQQIDDDKKTLVTHALLNIKALQTTQGVVAVGTPTVGGVDPGTIIQHAQCATKNTPKRQSL